MHPCYFQVSKGYSKVVFKIKCSQILSQQESSFLQWVSCCKDLLNRGKQSALRKLSLVKYTPSIKYSLVFKLNPPGSQTVMQIALNRGQTTLTIGKGMNTVMLGLKL